MKIVYFVKKKRYNFQKLTMENITSNPYLHKVQNGNFRGHISMGAFVLDFFKKNLFFFLKNPFYNLIVFVSDYFKKLFSKKIIFNHKMKAISNSFSRIYF
jgi:hypothetical protein